jgi:predicted MPP superfamily phosphohydrolase
VPDVILLAGDYGCTDVESIRELAPILGRLNGKYGVFAILGNYDYWHQPDLIRAQLAECQTTPTGTFRTACAAAMTITADTRSHRPERHMEPPAR